MSTQGKGHSSTAEALAAILGPNGPDHEPAEAGHDPSLESDDLTTDGQEPALDVEFVGDAATQQAGPPPRRPRRGRTPSKPLGGGTAVRLAGLTCLGTGITMQVLQAQGKLSAAFAASGIGPVTVLGIGALLIVIGVLRRQMAQAQQRIDALAQDQQDAQADLQNDIRYLVEQQQAHAERPPAQGEELERVLLTIQRQDEKVNNISRALKMYGKPLMEIANQSADVSGQVNQLKGHLEAVLTAFQQGFTRIESAVKTASIDLTPLHQQARKLAEETQRSVAAMGEKLGEKIPDGSLLSQQLVRVEACVQALSQRTDDSELRKSLLRLEDSGKATSKKLEELAHTEIVHTEVQKLERLLDTTTSKLGSAVEQVRSKNLGALETSVRDMQRELAGLATAVAYIQQAVRNGPTPTARSTPAPAPMPAPSPVAASMPEAPAHAPAAAPAASATHAPAPPAAHAPAPSAGQAPAGGGSTDDAQSGVDQNRTGARSSSGKNVLGAIAKLKKLKQ